MDASISHMLRDARGRLRLTLLQLADRVGIPAATLRAYERGSRVPGRDRLIRITDALEFSRSEQNIVLEATGYAQNFDSSNPALRPTWYQLGDLQGVVNRVPWPTFIGNELSELVVAYDAFQALVGVDLREEFTEVWERNLMMIASNPRFADRIVNWDALAGVLIANAKGSHYFPQTLEAPSPYFARVLDEFARGEPWYVKRFAQLWDETPLVENHQRWEYPVIWEGRRVRAAGDARGHCQF